VEEESRRDVCVCVGGGGGVYLSEGGTAQNMETAWQRRRIRKIRRKYTRVHSEELMSATNNFYVTKLDDKPTSLDISQITANKRAYNYKPSSAVKSCKYSVSWSRCNATIMLQLCVSSNLTTLCHKLYLNQGNIVQRTSWL